jgi:hypothetical protein
MTSPKVLYPIQIREETGPLLRPIPAPGELFTLLSVVSKKGQVTPSGSIPETTSSQEYSGFDLFFRYFLHRFIPLREVPGNEHRSLKHHCHLSSITASAALTRNNFRYLLLWNLSLVIA